MTLRPKTQGITIKPLQATSEILEPLSELINICYRSTQNWTNESKIVSGYRTTPSQLLRDSRSYEIYTAYDGDKLIGCIKTGKVDDTLIGKLGDSAGYVGLLAVHPDYQSKGMGTRLIKFAEKRCAELGVSNMIMDVLSPRTDIMEWYKRMGYTPTGGSTDAKPVIEGNGEALLVDASFIILQKRL